MKVSGDHIYVQDPVLGSTLKSNAHCYIQREISREHVYTNDRGWRVEAQNLPASPSDIAFVGCSWPMGVGSEYEDSFVYQLSTMLPYTFANLGVGSYSLLQAYRRLEQDIKFIKPKLVVVFYGHWLLDRCFKSNAMGNVIHRPIFRRSLKTSKLYIEEPRIVIPFVLREYLDLNRKIQVSGKSFLRTIYQKFLYFLILLQKSSLRRIFYKNSEYVLFNDNPKYYEDRAYALKYLLERFENLGKSNNCKVLFFHAHKYTANSKVERSCIELDDTVLKDYINNSECLYYEPPMTMERVLNSSDAYKQAGNDADFISLIHLPDNNHPNATGHGLIAQTLAEAIDKVKL